MKKYILPLMLLFLSLYLFGCKNHHLNNNNNIPNADSIEIIKHKTSGDTLEQTITITDTEIVNYIVDNLNSLTLKKMDYIKPNVVMYTLVFYESGVEVKQVNIKSNTYLSFSGDNTPYAITKGELDLEYLDALFTPPKEEETIKQLIIDAYEKKYNVEISCGVSIITKFDNNGKQVVSFKIGDYADDIVWAEKVGGVTFYYRNSLKILIYYNDEIYTLQEAFAIDLLNQENLIDIARIQNENCKLGHSWDEGVIDHKVPTGEKVLVKKCYVCGETKIEPIEDVICNVIVNDVNFHYVETGYCELETSYNLIYSKNDLTRYYENNKEKYNLENNIYATRFLEVCDSYTSTFFENNVLILIPTSVGNTADELVITSYQVDDEYFIINVETHCPESDVEGATVMVGCHLFLEVKEEHLNNAQYIKIIKDGIWDNEPKQERKLSDWYKFLNTVNVEDIQEVQWINYRGSIAPGALQDTKFSNDETDISNIFNYFKNLKLELTEPDQIEEIEPGYAPKYYAFVTEDEIYYIYLNSYFNKNSAFYTIDYKVPEITNAIAANNILDHSAKHNVYFTTKSDPWVLDEISYLGDLMISEYDNDTKYHMSDELYIDFNGIKIRIIDEKHFEYGQKYYEIIGIVDFSEIYLKMAPISARKNNYTVTVYYSIEELDALLEIKYMDDQTVECSAITSILRKESKDIFSNWYLYLDKECTILFEDTVITDDIIVYATRNAPERNEADVYSLTITGRVEYVIEDITGEYQENSLIMITTQTLIDADIEVYVNGVKAEKDKNSNHEGTELFMFNMPSEDAVVEIKVVTSKYFTVTLHDLDDYQWVNDLDKNDIIKVKYESVAVGIAPGNLVNIVYSNDPEDISNLYDSIILARYIEMDAKYAVMDGGGYRKYEFITEDKTYSIYLSNGFITSQQNHPSADVTELKYYKFLGEYYTFTNPSLECNSFLVYNDTYQAYNAVDDTLIGEYEGLGGFEFIPYEGLIVDWVTPYYIETQFGRVDIHTNGIIYLKEGNTFTYYQIVGDKDFSFLFGN